MVVARGTAGVVDVIHTMQVHLWMAISDVENRLRAQAGAFRENQAWSAEPLAEKIFESLKGNRQLEKRIAILALLAELHRQLPLEHALAVTLQTLKCYIVAFERTGRGR